MNAVRLGHAAALLNDGRVLVVGGAMADGTALSSADIYDPATGTFTPTGSMSTGRSYLTATLLNNGSVLVAGGTNASGFPLTAEIYDSAVKTFVLTTGSINAGRYAHTATLLNNGQVLITGGAAMGYLNSAEIYDPPTELFSTTGSLSALHFNGTATLLNDGQVLIAGGYDGGNVSRVTETYDPTAGTFAQSGNLNTGRSGHTATLLTNGEVLVSGGDDVGGTGLSSAELYAPAVLTPTNLVSIAVTPASTSLSVGTTQQFTATGTYADNHTETLQSVVWTSSDTTVATVSNDSTNRGRVYGIVAGSPTITACAGTVCGSTALTISSLIISNCGVSLGTLSRTSATVTWQTNDPATSQVFFQIHPQSTWVSTSEDPTLVTSHSVTLTGLNRGSSYTMYCFSMAGAEQAQSPTSNFQTLP